MPDRTIACLISTDFEATARFYRYFGFEAICQNETSLKLARGHLELMFLSRSVPLKWDEDRTAIIMVDDVNAWRKYFADTRMRWKAMGRPGLTQISDGAWGCQAFNLSDRDGNLIWVVQDQRQP